MVNGTVEVVDELGTVVVDVVTPSEMVVTPDLYKVDVTDNSELRDELLEIDFDARLGGMTFEDNGIVLVSSVSVDVTGVRVIDVVDSERGTCRSF